MNDLTLLLLLVWPLAPIIFAPSMRTLAYAAAVAAIWYVGGIVSLFFLQEHAGAPGAIFVMMVGLFWMVPIILAGLKLISFHAWRLVRRRRTDTPRPNPIGQVRDGFREADIYGGLAHLLPIRGIECVREVLEPHTQISFRQMIGDLVLRPHKL